MYYAHQLFARKGVLARLWLAGTMFRKLNRKQILASNIASLCKNVRAPPVPLALRTQATLVHGIVRIHNKKSIYLLGDAMDARTRLSLIEKKGRKSADQRASTQARFDQVTVAAPRGGASSLQLLDQQQFGGLENFELDLSSLLENQAWAEIDLGPSSAKRQKLTAREEDITLSNSNAGFSQSQMQGIDFEDLDIDYSAESFSFEGLDLDLEMPREGGEGMGRESLGGLDMSSIAMGYEDDSMVAAPGSLMMDIGESLDLGGEMDMPEMDMPSPMPEGQAQPERKRARGVKRKRMETEDSNTEILDSVMRAAIQDASSLLIDRPHAARLGKDIVRDRMSRMGLIPSMGQQFLASQLVNNYLHRVEMNKESELRQAENVDEEMLLQMEMVSDVEARRGASDIEMDMPDMSDILPMDNFDDSQDMKRGDMFAEEVPFEEEEPEPFSQMQQEMSQAGQEPEGAEDFQRQYSTVTKIFKKILRKAWKTNEEPGFKEALHGYSDAIYRKDAAISFQQLLLLRTMGEVECNQDEPWGPITVEKGAQWVSTGTKA
jgi:hypothetical protein